MNGELTIGKSRNAHFFHALPHSLSVRERLDEDGINTNPLKLLGTSQSLFPSVDKGVGSSKDKNILSLIAGIACRLNAGVCLPPRHHSFPLSVAASYKPFLLVWK